MATSTRNVAPLVLLPLLLGCASALGGLWLVDGPPFAEVEAVPAGQGLVYFYRVPEPRGGANGIQLYSTEPRALRTADAVAEAGEAESLVALEDAEGRFALYDVFARMEEAESGELSEDHPLMRTVASGGRALDLGMPRESFFPAGVGRTYLALRGFAFQGRIPKSGGYLPLFLEPGTYLFALGEEMGDEFGERPMQDVTGTDRMGVEFRLEALVVRVEAGETLYLRGGWLGSELAVVDGATALQEIGECALVEDQGTP